MHEYELKNYSGQYPILSVYFKMLHPEWGCSYDSIDKTMLHFLSWITNQDLIDLHLELMIILAKDEKEQFLIFSEHFDPQGFYIGEDHRHWTPLFFWTLVHFTEKEMRKRNIAIPETN